jgi:hypothetical protein
MDWIAAKKRISKLYEELKIKKEKIRTTRQSINAVAVPGPSTSAERTLNWQKMVTHIPFFNEH